MEWVSLIISIFALLLSALIFIKYDKKIKEQNIIINQYRLQQIEEEKQKKQKCKNFRLYRKRKYKRSKTCNY